MSPSLLILIAGTIAIVSLAIIFRRWLIEHSSGALRVGLIVLITALAMLGARKGAAKLRDLRDKLP